MRFVPLLSTRTIPSLWENHPVVELTWDGVLHEDWQKPLQSGREIHALHIPSASWDTTLAPKVVAALQDLPDLDFLVLPAALARSRIEHAAFLGTLELLLEFLSDRGIKLVLKPARDAESGLASLLKDIACDAVGFCWHEDVHDVETISDRIFCAVTSRDTDLSPLRHLGYRWNVAIPAEDPANFQVIQNDLSRKYPMMQRVCP